MTLGIFELVWLLALPWMLGTALLGALGVPPSCDRLAKVAWQLLIGSFATALVLLLWSFAQWPYRAGALNAVLVGVAIAAAVAAWRRRGRAAPPALQDQGPTRRSFSLFERGFFALCVMVALGIAGERAWLFVGSTPVLYGDESLNWAARAQLLFVGEGFSPYYVDRLNGYLTHGDYPLLNPLLQVWAFAMAGELVHFENRLPLQILSVALLLLLASVLRRFLRPGLAGPLVVLVVLQEFLQNAGFRANADHLVALGLLAAVEARERWRLEGDRRWRVLYAIALAFLVWSKQEGTMIALVLLVLTPGVRWREGLRSFLRSWWPGLGPWFLLPTAFVALNSALPALHGVENDVMQNDLGGGFQQRLQDGLRTRTAPVLELVARETIVRPAGSEPILPLFLFLLLACPKLSFRTPRGALALTIVGILCAYIVAYIGHFAALPYIIVTTWMRLSFHVTPLALVWIASLLADLSPRLRSE